MADSSGITGRKRPFPLDAEPDYSVTDFSTLPIVPRGALLAIASFFLPTPSGDSIFRVGVADGSAFFEGPTQITAFDGQADLAARQVPTVVARGGHAVPADNQ